MASEREVAAQAQEKFHFYLVGLVFTLLALSVQTGKFVGPALKDAFEVGGWIALLCSGIAGLWRLEYVPVIREKFALLAESQAMIEALEADKARGATTVFVAELGTNMPITARIDQHRNAFGRLEALTKKLERHGERKYTVHRHGFALGLFLLIGARAYEPVSTFCAWAARHVT